MHRDPVPGFSGSPVPPALGAPGIPDALPAFLEASGAHAAAAAERGDLRAAWRLLEAAMRLLEGAGARPELRGVVESEIARQAGAAGLGGGDGGRS